MKFNESLMASLSKIANWTKFFSIIGYISAGLMILGSIIVMLAMPFGIITAIIYIGISIIYIFSSNYLFRYSRDVKAGMLNNDQDGVNYAFENLASYFKLWGIFTIVVIGIYVLIFIIAAFGGLVASSLPYSF